MAPLMGLEMHTIFFFKHLVSENLKKVFPFHLVIPPEEGDPERRQMFTCRSVRSYRVLYSLSI